MFNWASIVYTTTRGKAVAAVIGSAVAGGLIGRYTKHGITYYGEKLDSFRVERKRKDDAFEARVAARVEEKMRADAKIVADAEAKAKAKDAPSIITG